MKYAGLIKNDMTAAPGVSVTFFTQGCPHQCKGCHNPETWSFTKGKDFTTEVLDEIIKALTANGLERTLSIMGGEPLCPENEFLTNLIVSTIKEKLPNIKIYIWTGYTYEYLLKHKTPKLENILNSIDCLIDGPYVEEERDITLPMRGSRNQRIIFLDKIENI